VRTGVVTGAHGVGARRSSVALRLLQEYGLLDVQRRRLSQSADDAVSQELVRGLEAVALTVG